MSNKALLRSFYELDQFDATQVMYVWIDETGENLRAKTLTIEKRNVESLEGLLKIVLHSILCKKTELPLWNAHASGFSCQGDIYLKPVRLFRDPFRRGNNKLVLCETYTADMEPTCKGKSTQTSSILQPPIVARRVWKR